MLRTNEVPAQESLTDRILGVISVEPMTPSQIAGKLKCQIADIGPAIQWLIDMELASPDIDWRLTPISREVILDDPEVEC